MKLLSKFAIIFLKRFKMKGLEVNRRRFKNSSGKGFKTSKSLPDGLLVFPNTIMVFKMRALLSIIPKKLLDTSSNPLTAKDRLLNKDGIKLFTLGQSKTYKNCFRLQRIKQFRKNRVKDTTTLTNNWLTDSRMDTVLTGNSSENRANKVFRKYLKLPPFGPKVISSKFPKQWFWSCVGFVSPRFRVIGTLVWI